MENIGITAANLTGTTYFNEWGEPTFIKAIEVGETIEFIYKQTSMISYTVYPPSQPRERVFKVVYSCKDGKWNKSKPIYGTIIPPTEEDYDFEDYDFD